MQLYLGSEFFQPDFHKKVNTSLNNEHFQNKFTLI